MRAIVFGQSGLSKTAYLQAVLEEARAAKEDFEIINLGQAMQARDPDGRNPQLYPSIGTSEVQILRSFAQDDILRKINAQPNRDYVLNAHAVFRTDSGMVPGSDVEFFEKFSPGAIIIILDDFHYIHRRLQGSPFEKLTYANILEWRDGELFAAQAIANQVLRRAADELASWPFFVVPRGHHPNVIFRLLYEGDRKRIYSSFAITGASAAEKQQVSDFKARLAEAHVVFDPYTIVERGLLSHAETLLEEASEALESEEEVKTSYGALIETLEAAEIGGMLDLRSDFVAQEALPGIATFTHEPSEEERLCRADVVSAKLFEPYRFRLDEALSLLGAVDGQIIRRDYLLIDQSQIVCARVPWDADRDKPWVSAGSQSELTYAKLKGRPRFVVCEGKRASMSPWIREHATQLFRTVEELEEHLGR